MIGCLAADAKISFGIFFFLLIYLDGGWKGNSEELMSLGFSGRQEFGLLLLSPGSYMKPVALGCQAKEGG